MKSFLKRALNGIAGFVLVVLVLFYFLTVLKLVAETVAPITTFLFVCGFTVAACRKWFTGLLAIIGIVLYASSWVYFPYNTIRGSCVCSLGIGLWFMAAYRTMMLTLQVIRKHVEMI